MSGYQFERECRTRAHLRRLGECARCSHRQIIFAVAEFRRERAADLKFDNVGGLRAQILSEGTIHVGDIVRA